MRNLTKPALEVNGGIIRVWEVGNEAVLDYVQHKCILTAIELDLESIKTWRKALDIAERHLTKAKDIEVGKIYKADDEIFRVDSMGKTGGISKAILLKLCPSTFNAVGFYVEVEKDVEIKHDFVSNCTVVSEASKDGLIFEVALSFFENNVLFGRVHVGDTLVNIQTGELMEVDAHNLNDAIKGISNLTHKMHKKLPFVKSVYNG